MGLFRGDDDWCSVYDFVLDRANLRFAQLTEDQFWDRMRDCPAQEAMVTAPEGMNLYHLLYNRVECAHSDEAAQDLFRAAFDVDGLRKKLRSLVRAVELFECCNSDIT